MAFHILPASNHRLMPWKNGGGSTVEIAVCPEDADLSGFDWRISMARVERDGPFSMFPGIDRSLCILDGDGVVLHGGEPVSRAVTSMSEPAVFPGDVPVHCTLLGRAVTDLNVMTRRGRFRHSIERLRLGSQRLRAEGQLVFLFATDETALRDDSGTSALLAARDMARLDGHGLVTVESRSDCYLIALHPDA